MSHSAPKSSPASPYWVERVGQLSEWLEPHEGITERIMFGVPAWCVSGRVFVCVWGPGVGLRLPKAHAESIAGVEGVAPFCPFGRAPMSGWLLRSAFEPGDLALSKALVLAAYAYVRAL